MYITASVKFTDNTADVKREYERKIINGVNRMATEIMSSSLARTPMKTGALRRNRSKSVDGMQATVTWQQPYAAVQEAGHRRGARPFRKYTTPGTGKDFVRNALSKISSDPTRYFK